MLLIILLSKQTTCMQIHVTTRMAEYLVVCLCLRLQKQTNSVSYLVATHIM